MALPATTAFNVRTDGADTNGGGFVPGSSGTDFSLQAAAQLSNTDLVLVTTTTCTSAGSPFGATSVGNLIQITGGTGFTTGFYQVVSVAGVTATLDRAAGTGGSTGGTFALGGALLTISKALGAVVSSNRINIKSGTYTITSALVPSTSGLNSSGPIVIEGYGTTPSDLGTKPLITTSTNSVHIFTITNASYLVFRNLSISSTAGTRGDGFRTNSSSPTNITIDRCTLDGFDRGLNFDHSPVWRVTGLSLTNSTIQNCVHGIMVSAGILAVNCYIKGCTTDGVGTPGTQDGVVYTFIRCVFYGNVAGIESSTAVGELFACINCIFSDNSAYGYKFPNTSTNIIPLTIMNCIFYNNATKDVYNNNSTPNNLGFVLNAAKNAYNGSSTGWISADITLSADPFNGRTSDDFSLNNTAGGGLLLRGLGFNGPSLFGTGYVDVGAVQHADPVTVSGMIVNPGMTGGVK